MYSSSCVSLFSQRYNFFFFFFLRFVSGVLCSDTRVEVEAGGVLLPPECSGDKALFARLHMYVNVRMCVYFRRYREG